MGEPWDFVVSATSRTGYELASRLFSNRASVFYCPLDFTWAVKRAFRRIQPDALVLVELELWPNLIRAAKRSGAKVAVVNGRISDRSFRSYRRLRPFFAKALNNVDLILAQDEIAREYFRRLAPSHKRILVSGSVKFDGVQTERERPAVERLAKLLDVQPEDAVYLCGSTQAPEESAALETYRRLYRDYPQLKVFVAPRHPERFEQVAKLFEDSGLPWTRRSLVEENRERDPETKQDSNPRRLVLIDSIGELADWWGVAKIAFVGGSWGSRGGQNMLEPAGYGVAVSFGPNTQNFRAITEILLREKCAVVVKDENEATAFVKKCLDSPELRDSLGQKAQALVRANQGAAEFTLNALAELLRS